MKNKLNAHMNYVSADNKIDNKYMAQVELQIYLSNRKNAVFCVAEPIFKNRKMLKSCKYHTMNIIV